MASGTQKREFQSLNICLHLIRWALECFKIKHNKQKMNDHCILCLWYSYVIPHRVSLPLTLPKVCSYQSVVLWHDISKGPRWQCLDTLNAVFYSPAENLCYQVQIKCLSLTVKKTLKVFHWIRRIEFSWKLFLLC